MRPVKVVQGRAEATVNADDRVNFSDVIGEAIGVASIHIDNVVLEYDGSFNVMYSIGKERDQALFCTLWIDVSSNG